MTSEAALRRRGDTLSWLEASGSPEWFQALRPEGIPDQVDVILITHPRFPEDLSCFFPWAEQLTTAEQERLLRCLRPLLLETVVMPGLTAGMMFLPVHAGDILNPRRTPIARQILLQDAFPMAARYGAKVVCLGGLNGALSRYGHRLTPLARGLGIDVTIGHSITVICVWETLVSALRQLGRTLAAQTVSLVGVGGIGEGLLNLMALRRQWPARLILVDRPRQQGRIRQALSALNVPAHCRVELVDAPAGQALPAEHRAYDADAILTATSQADVIDMAHVRPGTVLVDDSQPHCWSREAAWQRVQSQQDIVPCDTGLVDCTSLEWFSRFNFGFAGERARSTAWSCLVEGLLKGLDPTLPCTLGHPDTQTLAAWDEAFGRFGLAPAPLQCGGHELPMADLRRHFEAADFRSGSA